MRICTSCGANKIEDEFPMREKGWKRASCKSCLYQYQMKRWNKRKLQAIAHLGGECVDCGLKDHPCAYDFHHRDPSQKEVVWTKLRIRSWDKIAIELDKCDLLCSICHRKRHLNPVLWPRWDSNPQPRT